MAVKLPVSMPDNWSGGTEGNAEIGNTFEFWSAFVNICTAEFPANFALLRERGDANLNEYKECWKLSVETRISHIQIIVSQFIQLYVYIALLCWLFNQLDTSNQFSESSIILFCSVILSPFIFFSVTNKRNRIEARWRLNSDKILRACVAIQRKNWYKWILKQAESRIRSCD